MSRLNPARLLAAEVGAAVRTRDAFAADVLDARLVHSTLSAEDKAFARLLCLGVAATWGTLDEVIDFSLRSSRDVQADVRDALRISTYEIIFLKKADHAAVDQGVELVRAIQPKASRLANAVLRKIVLAGQEFPFGDPATDDAALARSFGFPLWMAKLLIGQLGRNRAAEFMDICNGQAPVFFGVNAVKCTDDMFKHAMTQQKCTVEQVRLQNGMVLAGCYLADDASAVAGSQARTLFDQGKILVSDAAAQCTAYIAVPENQPGNFLEVGSGRGTKTILLQSNAQRRWDRQMNLTTIDSHGFKDELLKKRVARYGIEVDQVLQADARNLAGPLGDVMFEAALVDAPCSGLGTLRRHPEIRWKLHSHELDSLAQLGFQLLEEVARHVSVGGQVTYSTCTISAQENEYVIKRFLEGETGHNFRIVPSSVGRLSKLFMKTPLTAQGCDAHFAARLRRIR